MSWYTPLPVPRSLSNKLACGWTATVQDSHRLFPDGCTDLLWLDNGSIVLCGPETEAWEVTVPPGTSAVGVRLRPGIAPAVFRSPAVEWTNSRLSFDDLVGTRVGREWSERIGESDRRVETLTELVGGLAAPVEGDATDGLLTTLLTSDDPGPMAQVAREVGLSSRQLQRRGNRLFGYGPSMLVRILRFQRMLRRAERGEHRTIGRLAAVAGYADQAHLTREVRALTGFTPTRLLAQHAPTFPGMSDPFKTSTTEPATMTA